MGYAKRHRPETPAQPREAFPTMKLRKFITLATAGTATAGLSLLGLGVSPAFAVDQPVTFEVTRWQPGDCPDANGRHRPCPRHPGCHAGHYYQRWPRRFRPHGCVDRVRVGHRLDRERWRIDPRRPDHAGRDALVRWNHPERGLLLPGSFIDAAERSGVILELGRVVFDTACRQAAEWRRGGSDLGVAVNLSTKQFADVALFDNITEVLTASGLDPRALWLEVTETALVEDLDQATIDDFGTGWASLTYLKQFPVHVLKIDRSFVAGIDHNPQDAAIARSIISLGEELDMIVVAEGIETLAQQCALQTLGCSVGQGFLYGRPLPAAEVPIERANRL